MQTQIEFESTDVMNTLTTPPSLDGIQSLGFDTETTNERSIYNRKLAGISYRLPDGTKGYMPICHPRSNNHDPQAIQAWAKKELQGKTLIVANAKHEADTMQRFGVNCEDLGVKFRDVLLQAPLLNEHRNRTNLDLLATEEFGHGKVDIGNTKQYPIHERSASEIEPYATEDAALVWDLNEVYLPRLQEQELEQVLELEDSLVYAICEMERNGTFLDVEKMYRWHAEVTKEYEDHVWMLHKHTGMNINPGSGQDLERMFKYFNLPYPRTAPTDDYPDGQASFPEEFLETVQHPDAILAMEARQLASLLSKYLTKYSNAVEQNGLLRYSLHQLRQDDGGTITGRFSSSSVNIQQVSVKKKMPLYTQRWPIRELFIPPRGRVWLSADASQIEYRLFAHYVSAAGFGDRLARAYRDDPTLDFHNLIVQWTGLIRDQAKNVNFAKLYGGGPGKIATMCKLSLSDGYLLCDKYDHTFPEAKRLLDMTTKLAESRHYVRTVLGRRRRYRTGDRFYSAMNSILQGTAADIMKRKILELYRNRKRLGLTPRFTVHDEKDGDVESNEALPEIQKLLDTQTTALNVPIIWNAKTGANWQEAH
jgi:DNA polymerase I-like protein with 3'-5' exonuclease and polymerase domains